MLVGQTAMASSGVKGDGVYVDSECCTNCGVPWHLAPEVLRRGVDVCYVKRQPEGATELRKVLRVSGSKNSGAFGMLARIQKSYRSCSESVKAMRDNGPGETTVSVSCPTRARRRTGASVAALPLAPAAERLVSLTMRTRRREG